MALVVTKTANHWTAGIQSGWTVSRYVVTADDSATYGYSDFFAALGDHADFTYTEPTPNNTGNQNPTRTFTLGRASSLGATEGVVVLIQFPLQHEYAEATRVELPDNIWISPMAGEALSFSGSGNATDSYTINWDTAGGSHVIDLGSVVWRFPGTVGWMSTIQPVDLGDPRKTPNPVLIQNSMALVSVGPNQRFEALNNRLKLINHGGGGFRFDADFVGTGIIQVGGCWWLNDSNQASFFHVTNDNPQSQFDFIYSRDGRGNGGIDNSPEIFSAYPYLARHPYLSVDSRAAPPFTAKQTGGQGILDGYGSYSPNFAVSSRSGVNRQVDGVVVAGIPGSSYDDYAFILGNQPVDWLYLDPSWRMTGDSETPAQWSTNGAGKPVDAMFLRANSVVNRDSAGVNKTSVGWTLGRQTSSVTRAYRRNNTTGWVPAVGSSGTYSVREVNTTTATGVHYLHDCTKHASTNGADTDDWTRYTDSDNESWLLHRGGFHQYDTDVSLRSYPWSRTSLGFTGKTTNNDVSDLDCYTDTEIMLWASGVGGHFGVPVLTNGAFSNTATMIEVDGTSGWNAENVRNMVGGILTDSDGLSANAIGTITGATVTSTGAVQVTLAAAATRALSDNSDLYIRQANYAWSFDTDDGQFNFTSTNTKTLTYGGFASLIQAKLEIILAAKLTNLGTENFTYSNAQDSYWDSARTPNLNKILDGFIAVEGTDGSWVLDTDTAGQFNVRRLGTLGAATGHTVTLSPNGNCTHINFPSDFSVPNTFVMAGSYTDTNGTPSFLDVVFPTGIDSEHVQVSVAYQNADSEWLIGSNPDIQVDGTRNFIRVEAANNYPSGALGWHVAITGPRTNDFRVSYPASSQTDTLTLTQNVFYPATVTGTTGSMAIEGWHIDSDNGKSPDSDSEIPIGSTYPKTHMQEVNHLMLDFGTLSPNVGYSNATSGQAGIRRTVLDAKNSEIYADFVAVYGADPGRAIVGSGNVNLSADYYRIRITYPSTANFLLMDGAVPTNDAYYVYMGATMVDPTGNFGTPEYDASLVGVEVNRVISPVQTNLEGDLDRLAANQVRLSRGIPPRSTVSS